DPVVEEDDLRALDQGEVHRSRERGLDVALRRRVPEHDELVQPAAPKVVLAALGPASTGGVVQLADREFVHGSIVRRTAYGSGCSCRAAGALDGHPLPWADLRNS